MANSARHALPVLAACLIYATPTSAAPVAITSYDVEQTPGPGWGCWSHSYTGTITNTGRTVGGSVVCSPQGNQIFNYSGGSGTLNDRLRGMNLTAIHLFTTRNAQDGQPIRPLIVLHLESAVVVDRIRLFGGDILANILPGALDGATVEIGGRSLALSTIPFGQPNAIGVPADDLLELTGTPLAGIRTDRVVLRNFTSSLFGSAFDQFSITEIEIDGRQASTPITIDVKPGGLPNAINSRSQGKIPVAILSGSDFHAPLEVDMASLTFGRTGNEASLSHCGGAEDVNADGLADVVCHFHSELTGFRAGDIEAVLKGSSVTGTPLEGTDSVEIVH